MAKKQPRKLTDQLRQIVLESGLSQYQIAKDTGVDKATLSRFIHGERGLSMEAMDAIGLYLGLELVAKQRPGKSKESR